MFTIELFSLLICIQSETPKRQKEKHVERPPPIRLSHIFANIICIYLQTVRSQIRLLLREQPNTGPQRSTEMAMTTQQTQRSDDLNVPDAPRVKGFIRYQIETR